MRQSSGGPYCGSIVAVTVAAGCCAVVARRLSMPNSGGGGPNVGPAPALALQDGWLRNSTKASGGCSEREAEYRCIVVASAVVVCW